MAAKPIKLKFNQRRLAGFSGNQLKLIAFFFMLCDHVGFMLIENGVLYGQNPIYWELALQTPEGQRWYLAARVLRFLGRLAFPLFAFLTVEGGEACQGDIEKLHYLYDQGVRMMTLTWNYPNELGYPNIDRMQMEGSTGQVDYTAASSPYVPDTEHGLTKTGIEFVKEMERIGMIIDVSHLSDAGFYDVLDNTTKPFVASHSNARKVCPFVRNLTDEMIRMLGERGGVTGLNYCHDFLFDNEISMNRVKMNGTSNAEIELSSEKYLDQTCEKIAEHARHIVNVGGMGVLGLGSDFDGIPPYVGMPEADKLDHLAHALGKKGFSTDQIDNIYYGNVMRVYEDVLL